MDIESSYNPSTMATHITATIHSGELMKLAQANILREFIEKAKDEMVKQFLTQHREEILSKINIDDILLQLIDNMSEAALRIQVKLNETKKLFSSQQLCKCEHSLGLHHGIYIRDSGYSGAYADNCKCGCRKFTPIDNIAFTVYYNRLKEELIKKQREENNNVVE